jgi:flavin reductase (DIM6/NTAB) family NADH-FMN oxidoreductase RutF
MSKVSFKPGTMVYPVPAVMVSCGIAPDSHNIITIAWTGILNSEPPMTYIAVRKSRHSHSILVKDREFVINLGSENLVHQIDFCGVKSGKDVNKWKLQNLTPIAATKVSCPMIKESPVNIECKVTQILELPSHDVFIAEIVAVNADEALMNKSGKLQLENAGLLCYSHGDYFGLNKALGRFGFSVMKEKTKKKLNQKKRKSIADA